MICFHWPIVELSRLSRLLERGDMLQCIRCDFLGSWVNMEKYPLKRTGLSSLHNSPTYQSVNKKVMILLILPVAWATLFNSIRCYDLDITSVTSFVNIWGFEVVLVEVLLGHFGRCWNCFCLHFSHVITNRYILKEITNKTDWWITVNVPNIC